LSVPSTDSATAVNAAVKVAAGLNITSTEPVVLADGANVIVHLTPSDVVAKVAASTTAIRRDPAAWLQRELDVAAFLVGAGAPVLAPSPEIPATTYHGDGHVMSFWRYLRSPDDERPRETVIGSMLRDLHAVLRTYPQPLPVLAPLTDIPAFLTRPQTRLTDAQSAAVGAAYARLTAELGGLAELDETGQPLHGDAGAGNLMATGKATGKANGKAAGWVWHDFEDTCSGPVTWDLAASTASQFQEGPRVLAAYGGPVDEDQLAVCEQLRRLHLTVWYSLYAERLPRLQSRADELLALWPVP
jgi:hypothetical protein